MANLIHFAWNKFSQFTQNVDFAWINICFFGYFSFEMFWTWKRGRKNISRSFFHLLLGEKLLWKYTTKALYSSYFQSQLNWSFFSSNQLEQEEFSRNFQISLFCRNLLLQKSPKTCNFLPVKLSRHRI